VRSDELFSHCWLRDAAAIKQVVLSELKHAVIQTALVVVDLLFLGRLNVDLLKLRPGAAVL
jgi:hypothetical protein